VLLAECSPLPRAPDPADLAAKAFKAPTRKGRIYCHRTPEFVGIGPFPENTVAIDGVVVGVIAPGRYVLSDVAPGPHTPVDIGSLRLLNAEGMDVSVFQSRPRKFAQRAPSSVYDVHITHAATPMQQAVYYLGFPPEWSVCSVRIAQTAAGGTRRAWTGLHSHVDDSSWIECPFSSASASRESLAIWVAVDSDPAHGVSRLPEFRALHHRHAPVETTRAAAHGAEPITSRRLGRSLVDAIDVKPGAFSVKIDLKAVLRSLSGAQQ
jgi:hypothetical protein